MSNPFAYPADRAVTIFSGVGASSLALRNLGYDVVPHDFMPEAVASLRANGFRRAREIDVRKIDWTVPAYDGTRVLVGGPPCQPFSQSHDGDGQYDPRDMIPEFLRAIDGLLPELFVMEEVQTLTWKKHIAYLEMVEGHMRTLGYRVEHRILDASKFGLAQKRKRLFVVGMREDIAQELDTFDPEPIRWPAQDRTPRTMAEILGWTEEVAFERNQQVPDERARVSIHDERWEWPMTRPAPTVVGSFRPEVAAAPGYRKAGDPPRQATPGSVVTTFAERLRLQDFPADWIVTGSQAKRDLQIGNSVPVGLIQALINLNA